MTPETAALNVSSLVADVEHAVAAADAAIAFVDKYAAFLPAQYRTPLDELKKILDTVDGFLKKL